jgi:MurNAc alpha-1-phosphate uridylyltransferase
MTHAMILAAGRGTRLKELTANTPKPLVPVAGVRPLIRTLGLLESAGVRDLVINLHYLGGQIEQAVADAPHGLRVAYSREDMLLDTGGGIKKALPLLGEAPFIAINGDVIWDEEGHPVLADLLKKFDEKRMDACLLLVPLTSAPTHKGKGDFTMGADGRLTLRTATQDSAPYVYTGIQILHPRFFDALPSGAFPLVEGYRRAQEKGRLFGQVYTGTWVDMGTPDGMEAAARLLTRQTPPATTDTARARLSA